MPFDQVEFGELRSDVRQLKAEMAEIRVVLDRLVALENQSLGAVWISRAFAGLIGAVIVIVLQYFARKS